MGRQYTIASHCPGCGVRFTAGMDGVLEAEEGNAVVYPLSPDSNVHSCDAIYFGFHCLPDELSIVGCPRCGSNVRIEVEDRGPSPLRGDDRDFMETPVTDLDMSVKARNVIQKAGVRVARDLLSLAATDIQCQIAISGADSDVLAEVRGFLAERRLTLRGESC